MSSGVCFWVVGGFGDYLLGTNVAVRSVNCCFSDGTTETLRDEWFLAGIIPIVLEDLSFFRFFMLFE